MGIKKLTPTSPSRRYQTYLTRDELTVGASPEKSLLEPKTRISGRNNDGHITVRRRGGGHKRFYRIIDFKRYILAPTGLEVGKAVMSGAEADILPGNTLPLINIPLGTQIHNIELRPGKGGQLARSAGAFAQLVAKEGMHAQIRMPSGEVRRVPLVCKATIGQVGNIEHENVSFGKAGRSRWKGLRPQVRGVAMNPVDHPHGGGEGKTSGGRNPVTPWGQPTRGYKTRHNKRTQKMILRDRRTK